MLLARRSFRGLRPAADAALSVGVPAVVVPDTVRRVDILADVLGGEAVLVACTSPGAVASDEARLHVHTGDVQHHFA